ncbi:TPA: hypothetical protein DEB00_03545 [Candidatus Uhrbacteria bacterium]|nr:hypothetical protein [Candidatus Uhrbacteria bacterium]
MKTIQEKGDWNLYVMEHAPRSGAFLQSWEWGTVKQLQGMVVDRYQGNEARCQLVTMSLPFKKQYGYIGRGPLGISHEAERDMITRLKQLREQDAFLRVDACRSIVGKPTKEVQPAQTLLTHVYADDQALLAGMHTKTRYNIRLAERKDVEIVLDAGEEGFEAFMTLTEATYKRHKIRSHTQSHYRAILDYLNGEGDAPRAFIAIAKQGTDVLAANLMIDWNGTRTYLHGASSDTNKQLMAPYLLHWKLLQNASFKEIFAYDWWGIAPEGVKNHPWEGVTRFKKGFGGEMVTMPSTVDVVVNPLWYGVYTLVKRLR